MNSIIGGVNSKLLKTWKIEFWKEIDGFACFRFCVFWILPVLDFACSKILLVKSYFFFLNLGI